MKPVSFSRTKGCECRAWGFDKTAKDVQQWSLTPAEAGDVCLSVSLALFPLTLGNKKNKTKQNKTKKQGNKDRWTGNSEQRTGKRN